MIASIDESTNLAVLAGREGNGWNYVFLKDCVDMCRPSRQLQHRITQLGRYGNQVDRKRRIMKAKRKAPISAESRCSMSRALLRHNRVHPLPGFLFDWRRFVKKTHRVLQCEFPSICVQLQKRMSSASTQTTFTSSVMWRVLHM